ncbi:MAG: 3'-5' exonuclease, partial [Chloroflexota bacterium]
EEERRLLYVGMTRAADELYLSHGATRFLGGSVAGGWPSRFLSEIGAIHLETRSSPAAAARPRLASVEPGETVIHGRWGQGTVVAVSGTGRDAMVTIEFETVGRQRLQLCHAPLSRRRSEANVVAG